MPQRILGRHTNGSVDVLHGALARCIRCGHCVAVCPKAALTLEHIAPSSLPLVEDAPLSDLQRDMLFKARRSTRAYKDEPVDRNVLLKALEGGPATRRRRPTVRKWRGCWWKAATGCTIWPPAWRTGCRRLPENTAMWHRLSAPGRIRSCGGPSLILAHGDANMPWNALDCAAAVSYLELALHSYGIGTCWSGFVIAAAGNGVDLGIPLPEGRKICGGLMIGYPAVQYARVPPRKPVRLTVIE